MKPRSIYENYDFVRGVQKTTTTTTSPVVVARGGREKVKSCKDDDGAQGWELSRPTLNVVGLKINSNSVKHNILNVVLGGRDYARSSGNCLLVILNLEF